MSQCQPITIKLHAVIIRLVINPVVLFNVHPLLLTVPQAPAQAVELKGECTGRVHEPFLNHVRYQVSCARDNLLPRLIYMLVGDGLGHEGDSQDDEAGGDEQDDREVEVVDAADDGGTVAGLGAAARPVGELGDHSGEADEQADDQAPESPLQCKMLSTQTPLSV